MFGWLIGKEDYSLSQLESLKKNIAIDRDKYNIAIIDDKKYAIFDSLKSIGYRIDYFKDIKNVLEVHKHHIVVCDILGVGKTFRSQYEGGFVISEIRNMYPSKFIIAFSGSTFDMNYNQFFKICDNVMNKNVDINTWSSTLDGAIRFINDPIKNWEKARGHLLHNNVPIEVVSKLEHKYVKAILKKNANIFNTHTPKVKVEYSNVVSTIDAIGTYTQIFISLLDHTA